MSRAQMRVSAPNTVQPIALDLGGHYRVLDLTCQLTALGAATNITASILTSTQNMIEVPQWPVLGTFTAITTVDTAVRASFPARSDSSDIPSR